MKTPDFFFENLLEMIILMEMVSFTTFPHNNIPNEVLGEVLKAILGPKVPQYLRNFIN